MVGLRSIRFTSSDQTIISKGNSAWALSRSGTTNFLKFSATGLTTTSVTGTVNVNDGHWHHAVGVYDGSTLCLYIDGALDNSASATGSISTNNYNVAIGRNEESSGREFNGSLFDVRVYNRAIAGEDVDTLYGLMGRWKLDEASGATASDSSDLGNAGTTYGGGSWVNGVINGGRQFDYSDGEDYVQIPNSASLQDIQEGDYSLAAWFKPADVPAGTCSANNAEYGIMLKTGSHEGITYTAGQFFQLDHYLTGNAWAGIGTWSNSYPPGRFYHVVGVVNRTAGVVQIYINGALINSGSFTPGTAAREYGTTPWYLGIGAPGASMYSWASKGIVDDARIYSRVLSPDEVLMMYGQGPPQGAIITKWVESQ